MQNQQVRYDDLLIQTGEAADHKRNDFSFHIFIPEAVVRWVSASLGVYSASRGALDQQLEGAFRTRCVW